MKKTYRNALRSRAMIREAFIALLAEKTIDRITVVDIVQRSDLSRNTFYAHYQDVYAVLEEYQQEALNALSAALEETALHGSLSDPLPLLLKAGEFLSTHRDSYRVLMNQPQSAQFLGKLRSMLLDFAREHIDSTGVRDPEGVLLFIEVLFAGFVELIRQALQGENTLSPEETARKIHRIWTHGITLYL